MEFVILYWQLFFIIVLTSLYYFHAGPPITCNQYKRSGMWISYCNHRKYLEFVITFTNHICLSNAGPPMTSKLSYKSSGKGILIMSYFTYFVWLTLVLVYLIPTTDLLSWNKVPGIPLVLLHSDSLIYPQKPDR